MTSMSTPNFVIITGPIRSGKTTRLLDIINKSDEVQGIFCPDIDGKKHIQFLPARTIYPLETVDMTTDRITVGKFTFDAHVLTAASDHLYHLSLVENTTVVIDEIGKLELRDEGLEPGLSHLIKRIKNCNFKIKVYIIVRDYLLDEVKQKYKI
jgi:nucleoside-triphosphatase THEP1